MSSFKGNNDRFGSLKTEKNTFRSKTDNREKRNKYKNEKQTPVPKPNRKNIVKELDNKELFPSLDNKIIVPEKEVTEKEVTEDTGKPKVSEYLKNCMNAEEKRNKITMVGWTEFRYDKHSHKTTVTRNGIKYTMDEYREKCTQQNMINQERENIIKTEETLNKICERNERQMYDDYEMYGEESMMWQEHCRYLKYLEEYPEDEEDIIDAETEDYDSYSD